MLTINVRNLLHGLTVDSVSEAMYEIIYQIFEDTFGKAGTTILTKYVDATDGEFYVPENKLKDFNDEIFELKPDQHKIFQSIKDSNLWDCQTDNDGQYIFYTGIVKESW